MWEFRYEKMRQVPAAFVELSSPEVAGIGIAGSCCVHLRVHVHVRVHVHNMWKMRQRGNVEVSMMFFPSFKNPVRRPL